ncbi:MAG: hypothetical protein P8L78_12495 [Mariniblastus sp.]|nr:hypothetical protein [Mariniblastus sp.]MDG2182505.1 hypothetical protein [Mariniblastus sp.]
MDLPATENEIHAILDQVLGYLNFSSGNHDDHFFSNLNDLFLVLNSADSNAILSSVPENETARSKQPSLVRQVRNALAERLAKNKDSNPVFRDATQANQVIELTFDKILPAYRKHHRDLLFHQSDELLFNSFFVGRVVEAVLTRDLSLEKTDEIVESSISALNNFLGHRPVATLESQQIEPYQHEWIRPVPIYIQNVGVAFGRYEQITKQALEILRETSPHILRAAHFDPAKLTELAIDPRAFDFDHPINQRPNHHFGQWDEHSIDGNGFFRRFIVHQVTLDSLVNRAAEMANENSEPERVQEAMTEASAVMAGTMLMASGISGSGPGTYDSNTTLATLLPVIAGYRDQFYVELMQRLPQAHRERLENESRIKHQPFGSVRQDLNSRLAKRRASQLVNCRLASIFARMGYPLAAEEQSKVVPVAAARIACQIDCLLSAASEATLRGELDEAFDSIPTIMSRLKRGIHCGAIVDPWNVLGFDANYSLFPAVENSVRDHRVHELVDVMERIFAHCSHLWSEAAANNRQKMCAAIRKEFLSIVNWWRQFAAHEVMAVDAVDADDIFQAAELVADALSLWQAGGASAGDIEFWAEHAELFDSPKAYALVIDALMQRSDYTTSTALLVHWMSQADYIPLQLGDSSFHQLVYRWVTEQKDLLNTTNPEELPPEDIWNRLRKFYDFIEANAGFYWDVPRFEVNRQIDRPNPREQYLDEVEDDENYDDADETDDGEDLFRHAYDDVTYTDTTNDGNEGEIFEGNTNSDDDLEAEVDRVLDRLEFLNTVSEYWSVAATIPLPVISRDQLTDKITDRLKKRRDIIKNWIAQAAKNRKQLLELLESINQYRLPTLGSDHDAMLLYDQHRLCRDSLLDLTISTCIETENAIRMLAAVIKAVDYLVDETDFPKIDSSVNDPHPTDSTTSDDLPETPTDSASSEETFVNGSAPVVFAYAAILMQNAELVINNFPALTNYLQKESLLYVPLSKGGDPAAIVRARVVQTAILDLLQRMPSLGLMTETFELTQTTLRMERENPIGRGAVTEFDEIFEVAFTSMVHVLVQANEKIREQRVEAGEEKKSVVDETQNNLFECTEMLTESMLMLWLDHSRTLRLSVLEKVHDAQAWERMVAFIQTYGRGLFTQQFLHLGNIRGILHQGVDRWLTEVQKSGTAVDLRLFDELELALPREKAVRYLSLILESIIENYNEYRDYNTTTTQSDNGESLHMFLDFLRLRSRYDRVCWNLKPVIWAHQILVNDQENGVARMWRRSLTERVGPEADKYLKILEDLRSKYSIRMESVSRRLEGKFAHQMQIDRLKALVAPAMKDPHNRKSARVFELLNHEAKAFARSTMGVGVDLPAWLAALESEVQLNLLPSRTPSSSNNLTVTPPTPCISELRAQLEKLTQSKD